MDRQMYTLCRMMTDEQFQAWVVDTIKDGWAHEGSLSYWQLRTAVDSGVDLVALLGHEVMQREEVMMFYKMPSDANFAAAYEAVAIADKEFRQGLAESYEQTMQAWRDRLAPIRATVPEHQHRLLFATKLRTGDLVRELQRAK